MAAQRRAVDGGLRDLVERGPLSDEQVFVVHVRPSSDRGVINIILLTLSVVLFVVAQFTTLRENLALTSGLESTVAARSAQLESVHHLQDLTLRAVDEERWLS